MIFQKLQNWYTEKFYWSKDLWDSISSDGIYGHCPKSHMDELDRRLKDMNQPVGLFIY
ncbi:MAG: addiction module protein [Planctomycetia bacterium]|nr:addiction module protein [Planctomycetia bacterium]